MAVPYADEVLILLGDMHARAILHDRAGGELLQTIPDRLEEHQVDVD